MNTIYLLAAIDDSINSVQVTFASSPKRYTFVTRDLLEIGDTVVVPANGGFQLARVEEFHSPAQLEQNSPLVYKWVVQKVDINNWNRLVDATKLVIDKINEMQRKKARQGMVDQLVQFLGEEQFNQVKNLLVNHAVDVDTTNS